MIPRAPPVTLQPVCTPAQSHDLSRKKDIGALFVLLLVGTVSCGFSSFLTTWFPKLRIRPWYLFTVTHWGTGVLLSMAFVHLIPESFQALQSPCMSEFWRSDFPPMPGAILFGGFLFVTILEMVFHPVRHALEATPEQQSCYTLPEGDTHCPRVYGVASAPDIQIQQDRRAERGEARLDDAITFTPEQRHRKELMLVWMLELGLVGHSVLVGLSLSTTEGGKFITSFVTGILHQIFQGMALGSRIALLPWPEKALQPWAMALIFGVTVPIGQGIGISVHGIYDEQSEIASTFIGVTNGFSAGILIFTALVELVSEDFISRKSWRLLRGRHRVYACCLLFFGGICQSILGAFI
ncbi:hypothetical protein MW887_004779 [Aspergillus wentii]|nr:hypothetical protein MW887_004779 [Aspergillus wentii]